MKNPKYIFAFTFLACLLGAVNAFASGDMYPVTPLRPGSGGGNGYMAYNGQAAYQFGPNVARGIFVQSTSTGANVISSGGKLYAVNSAAPLVDLNVYSYFTSRLNTYGTTTKPFAFAASGNTDWAVWSSAYGNVLPATSTLQIYYGFMDWSNGQLTFCPYEGLIIQADRKFTENDFPYTIADCPKAPDTVPVVSMSNQQINVSVLTSSDNASSTGNMSIATSSRYTYVFANNGIDNADQQRTDVLKILAVLVTWLLVSVYAVKLGKSITKSS